MFLLCGGTINSESPPMPHESGSIGQWQVRQPSELAIREMFETKTKYRRASD
jgi:hypothetical protein